MNPEPCRIKRASVHSIYPLCKLNELLNDIKTIDPTEKTIRYLVDCSNQLWFAREGAPNKTIPAHYQMTGEPHNVARCLAAGNIEFSADFTRIIMVNHKSGDFRPTFESVQWPLAILIANEPILAASSIELDETVRIEHLSASGGPQDIHLLSKSDLISWFRESIHIDTMNLQNQPSTIKAASYEPNGGVQRLKLFKGSSALFGRPLFSSDDETASQGSGAKRLRF